MSPPATIDYDEKGDMQAYEVALATRMVGIDMQLSSLEKVMSNADKPPTNEWVSAFFTRFPWISGFTGLKADGTIIGQVPSAPIKPLDFLPLLEEDKKQNFRALRGNVQDTPMGPEVFLAAPLYDGHDFLGVVSAHFDMRALLRFSSSPEELVILAPQALLWAGSYDFASTPMAGIKWDEIVLKQSRGTVTNANGVFYWTLRYLGNQPIIFAVPVKGSFGSVNHTLSGPTSDRDFTAPSPIHPAAARDTTRVGSDIQVAPDDILPGSDDSVLLPRNTSRPSPFGPHRAPQERELN